MHASSHLWEVVIQRHAHLLERYKSVAVLIQMSPSLSQLQFPFAAIAAPRSNTAEAEFQYHHSRPLLVQSLVGLSCRAPDW